ncbi:hypothetical protein RFI_26012 [Reticulomyxa filosa]|uniref:Uncharacterized protein n=1 Tax=Reticulomyxa filosa TaxID=46433 RepID=X6MCL3_RETFI|nr:hypothetical protein RFI_26012 [Reticulomyxa filosa]|eukprot:ETO11366.1 hypothetical protein RFI_26012 [Reticulomyxa filosa]
MTTDEHGHIHLSDMTGFTRLTASYSQGAARGDWNLETYLFSNDVPNEISMKEDTAVCIPFVHWDKQVQPKLLLYNTLYTKQYPECVKYDPNTKEIVLHKLKEGIYELLIFGWRNSIKVRVIQAKTVSLNYAFNEYEATELSKPKFLQICNISGNRKDV